MILICPMCAANYSLDDAGLRAGRRVRCAACGHGWTILPESTGANEIQLGSPQTDLEDAQQEYDGLVRSDVERMRSDAEQALARASPQHAYRQGLYNQHTRMLRLAAGIPWAVATLVIVAGLSGLILGRAQVTRLLPGAGKLYEFAGLTATHADFELHNLTVEHEFDGAVPVLVVSGQAVNISSGKRPPPGIGLTLVDRAGHPLDTLSAAIKEQVITPGAYGAFALRIPSLPQDAHALEVYFRPGGGHLKPESAASDHQSDAPSDDHGDAHADPHH